MPTVIMNKLYFAQIKQIYTNNFDQTEMCSNYSVGSEAIFWNVILRTKNIYILSIKFKY